MSKIQIGKKYKISDLSGVDSNKVVTVVPNIKIKVNNNGIPTNVEGAYSKPDWSKEVAIQYDNGEYGIMFKNRLTLINESSMEYALAKLIKENLDSKNYYEDLTTLDRYFLHTCKNQEISNEWDSYLEKLFIDDVTESGSQRQYLSELTRDEQYEAVQFGLKLKQKCESTVVSESLDLLNENLVTDIYNKIKNTIGNKADRIRRGLLRLGISKQMSPQEILSILRNVLLSKNIDTEDNSKKNLFKALFAISVVAEETVLWSYASKLFDNPLMSNSNLNILTALSVLMSGLTIYVFKKNFLDKNNESNNVDFINYDKEDLNILAMKIKSSFVNSNTENSKKWIEKLNDYLTKNKTESITDLSKVELNDLLKYAYDLSKKDEQIAKKPWYKKLINLFTKSNESLAGSQATELKELENGNLLMTINDEGKEEIKDLQENGLSENEILTEMLEGYLTNGYDNLTGLIGLTDSFIIGLNWDRNDEGDYIENEEAKAWWLPDYMVTDYIEKLLTEGQIIFTLAQSN